MHRFYVSPAQIQGNAIFLDGREAHHALHVLRLRKAAAVVVLNGQGVELSCEVQEIRKADLTLLVRERKSFPELKPRITLFQAIPKGKIIEDIIEKATELGVSRVVPLLTERTITHLDHDDAVAKQQKWQQVAIEAIKQCGQPWLPRVEAPISLQKCLEHKDSFDFGLVGSLEAGSRIPREVFQEWWSTHSPLETNIAVWIGPEGDFTAQEYAGIRTIGTIPITFGSLVLRVETAAVFALSVIRYEGLGRYGK
jgi:16S rRNA (uracil1498-N3)-methyltransferase